MPTDGTDERPLGRPTKFNDETIGRLCSALSDGMPIKGACVVAGIGVTTLAEWRANQPDLEARTSEAREHARLKALQAINEAGEKAFLQKMLDRRHRLHTTGQRLGEAMTEIISLNRMLN